MAQVICNGVEEYMRGIRSALINSVTIAEKKWNANHKCTHGGCANDSKHDLYMGCHLCDEHFEQRKSALKYLQSQGGFATIEYKPDVKER